MTEKLNKKWGDKLTTEQLKLLRNYMSSESTGKVSKITSDLSEIKRSCQSALVEFKRINRNEVISEKLDPVSSVISGLSTTDHSEENITKFLTVSKLVEELRSDNNAK
jgi:hypothetical protein